MIEEVDKALTEGADSLKETLNEQMSGMFGELSESSPLVVKEADNTGISSLLSFTYSDYLRLFVLIALYTSEEAVLLRTADVVQVNMAHVTGEEGYLLSESAVYVDISATVQVKPTLLALPLFADVEGNPTSERNWYTIEYEGIRGY